MTENEIVEHHHQTFESIKQVDEDGSEYWLARQLAPLLEYLQYRNFQPVLAKAKESCKKSGHDSDDHFADVRNMVDIGSGARRRIPDVRLSRYACYLVVQNGDPSKPVIANGQTYFAVQTRRQELSDEERFEGASEDDRRIILRGELKMHNNALSAAANDAGVETPLDYAIFQDHGYRGLYGGLTAKGIHQRKGLKKSHQILDHMGSTELAANLFRATQTEEKLRRDNVQGKGRANATHNEVGKKVRKAIEDIGGTMPEDLPTPDTSIQQLERLKKRAELPSDTGP